MPNGIEYESLLAYADGLLPEDEAREVEAALATQPEHAQTLARYQLIKNRIAQDDGVEPSAAAIARALAVFSASGVAALSARESWLTKWGAVQRFIAQRIFDSRVEVAGLRYVASDRINLSFQAEFAEVDLQLERAECPGQKQPQESRWNLIGQINYTTGRGTEESGLGMGPMQSAALSPQSSRLALTYSGSIAPLTEARADEHGMFTLQAAAGSYDLHIQLPQGVLVLPDIHIA